MNNGVKAEKENTPSEANLHEEEVLSGSVRWRVRPGTPAADFLQSAGGGPGEAGGVRALVPGRRSPGGGNCPRLWSREGVSSESVFFVGA